MELIHVHCTLLGVRVNVGDLAGALLLCSYGVFRVTAFVDFTFVVHTRSLSLSLSLFQSC